MGEDVMLYWRLSKFARQKNGRLLLNENPKVTISARRFDGMRIGKTLLLTHPLFILLTSKKRNSSGIGM
jgi:hypothetical protein